MNGERQPGCFVAFEGGEGAGKSTQVARLARRIDALTTREPGGTPLGAAIRALVLDPSTGAMSPRAEALLMAADRAQHVEAVIRPALAAGRHVVTDRYLYSSVAYQSGGRGLEATEIRDLSLWATTGLVPDLVVLLDVPVEVARARLAATTPDRLEAEGDHFHERVRTGFLRQAAAAPERWVVIDASRAPEHVAREIWAAVQARLPFVPDVLGESGEM